MAHQPLFPRQGETGRVVFVCEHGSAKSVVAAALFNRLAAQQGLDFSAVSRGTDPDVENHPAAIAGLAADGLEPQSQPCRLAPADLATAAAVVAFSPLPVGSKPPVPPREWQVPPVTENYVAARDAIASHIEQLLADLRKPLKRRDESLVVTQPTVEDVMAPPSWSLGEFRLRPLRPADAPALHAYISDPRVLEHTSIPRLDLAAVEASLARHLDGYATATSCRWALADDNDRLVGTCGFSNWSLPHAHAELVYDLHPALWGRGLMRVAVEQVLTWAFDTAGFNRVHAFVMTSNARPSGCSRHLASRAKALSGSIASPEGLRETSTSMPYFGERPALAACHLTTRCSGRRRRVRAGVAAELTQCQAARLCLRAGGTIRKSTEEAR